MTGLGKTINFSGTPRTWAGTQRLSIVDFVVPYVDYKYRGKKNLQMWRMLKMWRTDARTMGVKLANFHVWRTPTDEKTDMAISRGYVAHEYTYLLHGTIFKWMVIACMIHGKLKSYSSNCFPFKWVALATINRWILVRIHWNDWFDFDFYFFCQEISDNGLTLLLSSSQF